MPSNSSIAVCKSPPTTNCRFSRRSSSAKLPQSFALMSDGLSPVTKYTEATLMPPLTTAAQCAMEIRVVTNADEVAPGSKLRPKRFRVPTAVPALRPVREAPVVTMLSLTASVHTRLPPSRSMVRASSPAAATS